MFRREKRNEEERNVLDREETLFQFSLNFDKLMMEKCMKSAKTSF